MALHKLVFDATDADSIAASANVGAYLRSADGTLLTHTDVGGKKALDVRVAEGINVEVDLSAADDSVASWTNDGAGNPITSTTGFLDVYVQNGAGAAAVNIQDGGNSITVDAVDLDIRDLTHVSDSVKVGDGTDFLAVNADGSINITDNGGSITVDGTVTALQGTSPWVVSDAALANAAIKTVAETVGVAAAAIIDGADELAARKYVFIYNNGSKQAYVGASGVTTANGFPVPPGSILEARIGDAVDVFMIAAAAGQDVRTMQLS